MTKLTDSYLGGVPRLHCWNPHNDKADIQLLGGVTKLHRWNPHNDKADRQLLGGCNKTTPLKPTQ